MSCSLKISIYICKFVVTNLKVAFIWIRDFAVESFNLHTDYLPLMNRQICELKGSDFQRLGHEWDTAYSWGSSRCSHWFHIFSSSPLLFILSAHLRSFALSCLISLRKKVSHKLGMPTYTDTLFSMSSPLCPQNYCRHNPCPCPRLQIFLRTWMNIDTNRDIREINMKHIININ